jgi:hypothetical protein
LEACGSVRNGASKGGEGLNAPPKRIAIVALGPSSLRYIQQVNMAGDRDIVYDEVWTVNTYANVIKSDRLFHMDDFRIQEMRARAGNKRIAHMLEAIKKYEGPVYTCFPQPEFPSSVSFPLGEVIAKYKSLYFNNTVPYMLAFAGLLGVEKVTMFGADYTYPGRMAAEAGRACTEYWLGRLHSQGVEIEVCNQSTLMDGRDAVGGVFPLYGYKDLHNLILEENDRGEQRLRFEVKEVMPTAAEVEKSYDHGPDAEREADESVLWSPPQ